MLQRDAVHLEGAARGPAPEEFFEILVATRSVPIRIEYAAIRSLRSVIAAEGQSIGLLLGTRSSEALSVDRCELLPREAASPDGFVKAYSEHPAQRVVGFFRTQAAGWPEMQAADRDIAQRSFRHPGSLFLLIQTPARRPWSAALFDLDAEAASPASKPALEFFFDEYLLRNGYSTGLVPAAEEQELQDDPPLKSNKRTRWIAAGILGALVLLGTLGYLWLADKNRTESVSNPASSPLALKVVRSGNDFEVSWDRLAPALQQASRGSVTIRDGEITRTVSLSASQLREGRILYAPLFGDLNFRLEIQQGERTQAESVQVLSWDHPAAELAILGSPRSLPPLPPPPPSTQPESPLGPSSGRSAANTRSTPANTIPTPALPAPPARAKPNEAANGAPARAPIGVPARAPIAAAAPDKPPADRSVPPVTPNTLAPTPVPLAAPTVQSPAAVAESVTNAPAPSAARPAVSPIPAALPRALVPLPSGGSPTPAANSDPVNRPLPGPARNPSPEPNVISPVPVNRVSPNITPALKTAVQAHGGHLRMSVRVTVDTNGRVRTAEAVVPDGKATFADNLLKSAALEAARRWTFNPGKLNGKAVAGDFTIEFVFQ